MQIPASLRSDFIHIASERSIHIVGIRTRLQPSCVPLCADCHTQAPGAYPPVRKRVFEERQGLPLARMVERLNGGVANALRVKGRAPDGPPG